MHFPKFVPILNSSYTMDQLLTCRWLNRRDNNIHGDKASYPSDYVLNYLERFYSRIMPFYKPFEGGEETS